MTSSTALAESEQIIVPAYGRTSDGMLVARIEASVYAMFPSHNGGWHFAYCYPRNKPLANLTRADFFGNSGELADETAFRARIEEQAVHETQLHALGRRQLKARDYTPWGASQTTTRYADGIVAHSTAGHGGFVLAPERNLKIHPALRNAAGFYEEDCAWAAVAQAFPDVFTDYENRCADKTLRDWNPDAWEQIHGTTLEPGQSHAKDERAFQFANRWNWIVQSAIRSSSNPGFVECIAALGPDQTTRCRFLVPCDEYRIGRFGFVIDPGKHLPYDGPSDFVGFNASARG